MAADHALEWLLGKGAEDFARSHWGKATWHATHNSPRRFAELLQAEDVALFFRVARARGLRPLAFRNGERVACRDPLEEFIEGASLVLNRADLAWAPIGRLCQALRPLVHHAFAVVYLTPRRSQAVPPHTDDQDVFVVQVAGSKEWTVYDHCPVHHPFHDEQLGKQEDKPLPAAVFQGPRRRLVLHAGDCLFIPRGTPHEARAGDEASMHVTVTVQTSDATVATALAATISRALRGTPQGRRSLPPGAWPADGRARLRALVASVQPEITLDAARRAFDQRMSPHNAEQDDAVDQSAAIVLATCAGVRPGPPPGHPADDLVVSATRLVLLDDVGASICRQPTVHADGPCVEAIFTKAKPTPATLKLHFQAWYEAALQELAHRMRPGRLGTVLLVQDLPGLCPVELMALARRLVRVGVVHLPEKIDE